MTTTRRALVGYLLGAAAVFTAGAPGQGQPALRGPARAEVRGVLKAVDVPGKTITVAVGEGRQAATDRTFPLAKDVEVAYGASASRRAVYRAGNLADLPAGVPVVLTLAADQKAVRSILAEGPMVRGQLSAVDPQKGTMTVRLAPGRGDTAGEERTYALARDAEVAMDDGRGRRVSIKEARPADLAAGALVTLWLSVDQKQVQAVVAEGPTLVGLVKALDAGKSTLTVTLAPSRGGREAEEKTVTVAADADVLLDDGKGRRLSVKEGKLADVPPGAAVALKLSPDQSVVTLLRAEGPSIPGLIKAVDPAKGAVTFAVRVGRGESPEEKTLPVAQDVRVLVDGKERPLADLAVPDGGLFGMVRLSLDQKAIQGITAAPSR